MSSNQDEAYLLRNRDQAETERYVLSLRQVFSCYIVSSFPCQGANQPHRLNFQHDVLKKIMGSRIAHPQLPLEKIQSVADIATGTA